MQLQLHSHTDVCERDLWHISLSHGYDQYVAHTAANLDVAQESCSVLILSKPGIKLLTIDCQTIHQYLPVAQQHSLGRSLASAVSVEQTVHPITTSGVLWSALDALSELHRHIPRPACTVVTLSGNLHQLLHHH